MLVGGFRFDNFTEASQFTVPDVNFMNATLDKNLMTIPHPEGKTGDGFGVGITPMGDINKDGFLDFAVSAYFTDVPIPGADTGVLRRPRSRVDLQERQLAAAAAADAARAGGSVTPASSRTRR